MTTTQKKDMGDVSDGYHTFNELYDQRNLLFINLCLAYQEKAYWKKDRYAGWDCLYLDASQGQVSFHVPAKYRSMYMHVLPLIQEYDGHTSHDVLKRLSFGVV